MWRLAPGARLQVSTPESQFQLSRIEQPRLLIAGGIGVTPIYGMALSLQQKGLPFRMVYAGRTRAEMALLDELTVLGDRLTVIAEDVSGRPDFASLIASLPAHGETYMCGPLGMMDAVRHAWRAAGRSDELLRFETFGSSGRYPAAPFTVVIPSIQREVHVPAEITMLAALERAGISMVSDCQRGECGVCSVNVLAHDHAIDHRDVFYSASEHESVKKICPCVSRVAGGTLSIDIGWRRTP
jgi:vanillate O-demethylase ferredoxin subunit